jgi:hypothetical protein
MQARDRQRIFDSVELVGGAGSPAQGRLCIMSFAACLAGEPHTDDPACVSPVIRAFAIHVNDRMPREARQRLKPFAPRLIGTRDTLDHERAEVLRDALERVILPRAGTGGAAGGLFARLTGRLFGGGLPRRVRTLLDKSRRQGRGGSACDVEMAGAAARLICVAAYEATDPRSADWFWDQATLLLDRMCDVGQDARAPAAPRFDRLAHVPALRAAEGAASAG